MTKLLTVNEVCALPTETYVTGFAALCVKKEQKQSTKTGKPWWKLAFADEANSTLLLNSAMFFAPPFNEGQRVEMTGMGMKYKDGQYGKEMSIGDKTQILAQIEHRPAPADPVKRGEEDFSPTASFKVPGARVEPQKPVYGATVGMAMNLAVESLTKGLPHEKIAEQLTSESFHAAVHQTASDFIRTAARLERGELAEATSDKAPF